MYGTIGFAWFGFHLIVFTSSLSVRTQHERLLVYWNPDPNPPQQWILTYNVMGTAYHSVLTVPGNRTSANIYTADYRGVLYLIKLFSSNNGKERLEGTIIGRSDCSKHINTTIGSSYSVKSFGYPRGLTTGAICTWTFGGSINTWFRFELEDLDTGSSSCNSYLMVENEKFCENDTVNGTILVHQPSFVIRLAYRGTRDNRGVKFRVSAIHKLLQPSNVIAVNIGHTIAVEWKRPGYHPRNFTYVLRISHFPFASHEDLAIDGNVTRYVYPVNDHVGQNHSVQLQSISEDLASAFTDTLFVSTNCDKDIFIKATEKTTVLSEQYPHSYLPKLSCNFRFQTEADFYLLILTHDLDIGGGEMCDKTFIQIGNFGKFCADAPPQPRLVLQKHAMTMMFRTSDEADGKGINITIVSVAKPPIAPNNVITTSDETLIYLTWKPPSFQQEYIKGYSVQYFIAPSTPGATLSVDKNVHNVTINTQSHPGRLYAMRIAAFTEGGVGNFSHPFYVRSGCGHIFHILRHESVVIMSPSNKSGYYEPETLCQWVVKTESPLWIKITINQFVIEASDNCSNDYVDVTGVDRLCGFHEHRTIVIKETDVAVTFRSNDQNESKGFSISFKAVGPAPGQPKGVSVSQSGYAIFIKWMPPTLHRRYLTGYLVHYNFYGDKTGTKNRVDPNTNYHVLDMTSYPGRLVEIWLQADGDVELSNATKTSFIRTECGHAMDVTGITYIISPYYKDDYYRNVQCLWTLKIQTHDFMKVEFIRLNLNNKINTCENFILINNESRYCDDSYEHKSLLFNAAISLTLEWHTGQSGKEAYFLLSVEPAADPHKEIVPSGTVSSSSDINGSSTTLLMTSYFGTLLASTILTSTALLLHGKYATERSPKDTETLQTVLPSQEVRDLQKGVELQSTIVTDQVQTYSKESFVASQTAPMLNKETTVVSNRNFYDSKPDSSLRYDISPTGTFSVVSVVFSSSCYTEDKRTVVSTNSFKAFTAFTSTTLVATSGYAKESHSETMASGILTNVINTKTLQRGKYMSTSTQLFDSLSVFTAKDYQNYDSLQPSGSSSISVSSLSGSSVSLEDASKIMLTSRDEETENNVTPKKDKGQEKSHDSCDMKQLHPLVFVVCICNIISTIVLI